MIEAELTSANMTVQSKKSSAIGFAERLVFGSLYLVLSERNLDKLLLLVFEFGVGFWASRIRSRICPGNNCETTALDRAAFSISLLFRRCTY